MEMSSLVPVAGAPFLACPPSEAERKTGGKFGFGWIRRLPGKSLWRKLRGRGGSTDAAVQVWKEDPGEVMADVVADQIENIQNMHNDMMETARELSPTRMMSQQTKTHIKNMAKENWGALFMLGVEVAVYCAIFEEVKQTLKEATREVKYLGRAVEYFMDKMQPTGLFGPLYGFLIRVNLPF